MAEGAAPLAAMRLDRWLWWTRLTKTRSAAQAIAATGTLRIDGRRVDRAHALVRPGDIVVFYANNRVRNVRVEALPRRRGPGPEAQACYRDLTTDNASQQCAGD